MCVGGIERDSKGLGILVRLCQEQAALQASENRHAQPAGIRVRRQVSSVLHVREPGDEVTLPGAEARRQFGARRVVAVGELVGEVSDGAAVVSGRLGLIDASRNRYPGRR